MKKLLWHIDRAAFRFENPDDYDTWKTEKKVFFEFSPSQSDDAGNELFANPEKQETHFEVTEENGEVSISIKELERSDRVEELARMISGKVITNEAKAAADSLISNGYSKDTFN